MAEIKAIDGRSVHQICSGQVILDLSIAVKELVENSLDAEATAIDVKLKENGLESVQVSDNGSGVEEKNFTALTLKHHTSKLKEFSDLESVETFGFRGEALSSLCALCNVTICTRHTSSSVGHKLEYDHDGKVTSRSTVARQPGTTVTLKNLFKTLPVRYKELKKNIKKEYSRLLTLLNAYCIISTDVKITCSNQSGKSRHGVVLATQSGSSVEQNVVAVFGSKQLHSLSPFQQSTPSEEICQDFSLNSDEAAATSKMYTIRGLISNPIHGNGRSVPDRQFFYINSRPVELPRLARIINELYHVYNRHQFPVVILDVITCRDKVDINVTPDKRHVFVHNEKVLLCVIKTSLIRMYADHGGNVITSISRTQELSKPSVENQKTIEEVNHCDVTKEDQSNSTSSSIPNLPASPPPVKNCPIPAPLSLHNLAQFKSAASSSKETTSSPKKRSCSRFISSSVAKQPRLDSFVSRVKTIKQEPIRLSDHQSNCDENLKIDILTADDETPPVDLEQSENVPPHCPLSPRSNTEGHAFDSPRKHTDHDRQVIDVSMDRLKQWSARNSAPESNSYENISSFHAQIDPRQNASAEKELSRHLNHASFLAMKALGQFNLGFIIARLNNDLFIIDQHASDEIYNFEMLQRSTEIHSLKLVIPQRLQLDPSAHSVLIENIDVFKKNGFDFDVTQDHETGKEHIDMTRVPVSRNWEFGSSDVDELIFMLSDAPHVMCRPSRIRQMFASRACRKSIMIGTAMTYPEMSRLIKHMSEITHPWNCPHGRPTMRHLIDLSKIA